MPPVNRNNRAVGKGGCTIISSKCVEWSGPDIECLNLCAGDSIDEVTYQLALKVCYLMDNVLDFSELEFDCLVEEGQPTPENIVQLVNLLIEKVCYILSNCCKEGGVTPSPDDDPIPLPECLYYEDEEGHTITELPIDEYVELLAETICELILLGQQIQAEINNIQGRLSNVEKWIANFPGQQDVMITTQCLSGAAPGVETEISVAFEFMEGQLCNYVSVLGTPTELTEAIGFECDRLSVMPQMADPDHTMSEITGWVLLPDTIADTIKNMWLSICDLRARVEICCFENELCAPLPPTDIVISDLTINGCTITWTAPSTPSTEDPASYYIEIWEWDGVANVGMAPVDTATITTPTNTYTTTAILNNSVWYAIYVYAIYTNCGDSSALTYFGYAAEPQYLYCIGLEETLEEVEDTCDGNPANYNEVTLIATLKDYITNLPTVNTGTDIVVTVRLEVEDLCAETTTYEDVEITILTGNSSGSVVYDQNKQAYCGDKAACYATNKSVYCIEGISDEHTTACEDETMCLPE